MVKMYTSNWCGDCLVTKKMLERFEIPYQEINIEEDETAAAYVMKVNDGRRSVPTLVYNGEADSMSNFSRAKFDAFLDKHALR